MLTCVHLNCINHLVDPTFPQGVQLPQHRTGPASPSLPSAGAGRTKFTETGNKSRANARPEGRICRSGYSSVAAIEPIEPLGSRPIIREHPLFGSAENRRKTRSSDGRPATQLPATLRASESAPLLDNRSVTTCCRGSALCSNYPEHCSGLYPCIPDAAMTFSQNLRHLLIDSRCSPPRVALAFRPPGDTIRPLGVARPLVA